MGGDSAETQDRTSPFLDKRLGDTLASFSGRKHPTHFQFVRRAYTDG
jgi:hypothetical protein